MGITMACAQCHNHKYDPFTQKEYYQLYAIFNNTEDANGGDDRPTLSFTRPGSEATPRRDDRHARRRPARSSTPRRASSTPASPPGRSGLDRTKLPKEVADIVPVPEAKRTPQQKQRLVALSPQPVAAPARASRPRSRRWKAQLQSADGHDADPARGQAAARRTSTSAASTTNKGEAVQPGLPAALLSQPADGQASTGWRWRSWLVGDDNPLTARVAVNRLWEELFGIGIVETSEEFGTQGELPSHPELLDWLATEYVRSGWDTKAMLRLLVTSAAYRQSSRGDAGPRRSATRTTASWRAARACGCRPRPCATRRCSSPACSVAKMDGPPVQPPQPSFGLSAAFGSSTDWTTSAGEDRYRRGLYTRVAAQRPVPVADHVRRPGAARPAPSAALRHQHAAAGAGDAQRPGLHRGRPGAGPARPRRGRRDAPASASPTPSASRLTRPPTEREADAPRRPVRGRPQEVRRRPGRGAADRDQAARPAPKEMTVADLAAWTVVGNVLLNLDETLAKR